MLTDIAAYLIVLAIAVLLFWTIPPSRPRERCMLLLAISMIFIALLSPGGFLAVAALLAIAHASDLILHRVRKVPLLFAALALALAPLVITRLIDGLNFIHTLGIAFATVRTIGLVLNAYSAPQPTGLLEKALYMFLFPLYTVGPVEKSESFTEESFNGTFDLNAFLTGLARIAYGLFLIQFICNDFIDTAIRNWLPDTRNGFAGFTISQAWTFVFFRFFYTYINFVGFCEVAIGSCAMFGFRVIENFNYPFLATNVAEFWRRYHISMGNWITRYLFFPVVGLLGTKWSNYVATISAFMLFGLWHAFTWNYLFWGIMHGLALAAYHFYRRHVNWNKLNIPRPADVTASIVCCIVTISYVAWLQTFANIPTFQHALSLTARMFGI